jgi:allantoin racemase
VPRILYISANGVDLWNSQLKQVLCPWCSPGTELDIDHLADVAPEYYGANLPPNFQFLNQLLLRIKRAQDEGYHAAIIGCSADPGYREAKRLFKIPIIAPLTANLHLATLLRHNVSVLSPAAPGSRKAWGWYQGIARSACLDGCVASWREVPVRRLPDDEQRRLAVDDPVGLATMVLDAMREPILDGQALEVAKRAVWDDGADAVYFSCTLWSGMLDPVAEALDVPVLDAARGALMIAEALGAAYERSPAAAPVPQLADRAAR